MSKKVRSGGERGGTLKAKIGQSACLHLSFSCNRNVVTFSRYMRDSSAEMVSLKDAKRVRAGFMRVQSCSYAQPECRI